MQHEGSAARCLVIRAGVPALFLTKHRACHNSLHNTCMQCGFRSSTLKLTLPFLLCRGKGGALQMFATRDIAAGEEVVNNYGELSQVRWCGMTLVGAIRFTVNFLPCQYSRRSQCDQKGQVLAGKLCECFERRLSNMLNKRPLCALLHARLLSDSLAYFVTFPCCKWLKKCLLPLHLPAHHVYLGLHAGCRQSC